MTTPDETLPRPILFDMYTMVKRWFAPTETSLFSPAADVIMAGGAALVFYGIVRLFVNVDTDTLWWSWAVYYAAFFVNYPHFAASYQIAYSDSRRGFAAFASNRFFAVKLWWAGAIVPLILVGFFAFALGSGQAKTMGYLAQAMFFFVGWHYVKQIFGVFVVLSAAKRIFYSGLERWLLLAALHTLWLISFVGSNLTFTSYDYYGLPYVSGALPGWVYGALMTFLVLITGAWLVAMAHKIWLTKTWPPAGAIAAVLAIYVWYVPSAQHPIYFFIIPFFHSLQYLLFVLAYKRNSSVEAAGMDIEDKLPVQVATEHRNRLTLLGDAVFLVVPVAVLVYSLQARMSGSLEGAVSKWYSDVAAATSAPWVLSVLGVVVFACILLFSNSYLRRNPYGAFLLFFAKAFVLGALLFGIAPATLDVMAHMHLLPGVLSYDSAIFGTTLFLFFFTVFVNIHHYFIDNVIWKRDNPYVRDHLLPRRLQAGKRR